MSSGEKIWERVRDRLQRMREEVREDEKMARLTPRECGLIEGFADELLSGVFVRLEDLEKEIEEKGVGSPDPVFRERFKNIFNIFHTIAVNEPGLRQGRALGRLNDVWGLGIEAITGFLERRAGAVGVESWSIGASVGFPSGVTGTVSINFVKEK